MLRMTRIKLCTTNSNKYDFDIVCTVYFTKVFHIIPHHNLVKRTICIFCVAILSMEKHKAGNAGLFQSSKMFGPPNK